MTVRDPDTVDTIVEPDQEPAQPEPEPEREPVVDADSDPEPDPDAEADRNWQAMRSELDRWQDRAERSESALAGVTGLAPGDDGYDADTLAQLDTRSQAIMDAAFRGVLLEAGFSPDSGSGRVLAEALRDGKVEPDPEKVGEYAATFDFEPERFGPYNSMELVQIAGAQRLEQMMRSTVSDYTAGDPESQIEGQIIGAREAGDWTRASELQEELERRKKARR